LKETYKNKDTKAIAEKRKVTVKAKYGVDNMAQLESSKKKSKATCEKKYGVSSALEKKGILEKGEKAAHTEEAYKKRKATNLKKRGIEPQAQDPKTLKKMTKTHKKKTGYSLPMLNIEVKKKMIEQYGGIGRIRGYYYRDIHFDSSWELAYFLWLEGQGKEFIYHPNFTFEYIGDDGEIHLYHPDFLIEGVFYEIKGDQFFNENGEPYNCYTKTFWYNKYNEMKKQGVVILKQSDMKEPLDYVKKTFGKRFLKEHRIDKKELKE